MPDNSYQPYSLEKYTQTLANTLPAGDLFAARNIDGSVLRTLLHAMANEYLRLSNKQYELSQEWFIPTTVNLIEEWENALGIPDECFDRNTTLAMRQKQVFVKFAKMHLTTEIQWINLAAALGFRIRIDHFSLISTFPLTFPITLGGHKDARFTMIIVFLDLPTPSNIFPCTFPITFDDNSSIIKCVFAHCKPANVRIIYRYEG